MSVSCIIVSILVSVTIVSVNGILSDQQFFIESKRDIGTTYSLEIITDPQTMTLTMEGPQSIWMGVSFGAEDMFNVAAYVYYLDDVDNKWVFAERYLIDEEGPGEVIEIIDENHYDISHENGSTKIIFTRQWIGTHSKSFTLSNDDTEFHYGFARGIDGILSYHEREGRSHSVYTLLHINDLEFNCNDLDGSECNEIIDDEGDQLCGYNSVTEDCYDIIRQAPGSNINLFNSDGNSSQDMDKLFIIIYVLSGVTVSLIFVLCVGLYFHRKAKQIPHESIMSDPKDDRSVDHTNLIDHE